VRFYEGVETTELDWRVVNINLFLFLSSLTHGQLTMLQHNRLMFSQLSNYQRYLIYKALFGDFVIEKSPLTFYRVADSAAISKIITDKDYANNVILGLRFTRGRYTDQQGNERKLYHQEKSELILIFPNEKREIVSSFISYRL